MKAMPPRLCDDSPWPHHARPPSSERTERIKIVANKSDTELRNSSGDREIRRAGRNQEAHLVCRFRSFTRYVPRLTKQESTCSL